ncbi:MAG: DUF3795 domain-containing protein [Alkaliphilus sp.]
MSYCGINCKKCPVYIASISNSKALKQEVALDWRELLIKSLCCHRGF